MTCEVCNKPVDGCAACVYPQNPEAATCDSPICAECWDNEE